MNKINSYIMFEQLFDHLSRVDGFNKLNGKTYQEYITKCLKLDDNLKKLILNAKTGKSALQILDKHKIKYTHIFTN